MPRAFTAIEDDDIRQNLRSAAQDLFARQGVRRTSIEQLTRAVGIAKGSFYKYYPSKEVLFFELLSDAESRIREPLLIAPDPNSRYAFESRCAEVFQNILNDQLVPLMGDDGDFVAISRKVPQSVMAQHKHADQIFVDKLIKSWATASVNRQALQAGMSLFVLTALKSEFFGGNLHMARDIAIRGLADAIFID